MSTAVDRFVASGAVYDTATNTLLLNGVAVQISSQAVGNFLYNNGTNWVNQSLVAGTGISISGATITNAGVTSFQGVTGAVTLTAGSGITISGTTITNSGVTSISNSDGTLTISPTTGASVASINLGNANTWTALQTFSGGITIPTSAAIQMGTSVVNSSETDIAWSAGTISTTNPQFKLSALRYNASGDWSQVVMYFYDGTNFYQPLTLTYPATTSTYKNTLDDGSGNSIITGTITTQAYVAPYNYSVVMGSNSGGGVGWITFGGYSNVTNSNGNNFPMLYNITNGFSIGWNVLTAAHEIDLISGMANNIVASSNSDILALAKYTGSTQTDVTLYHAFGSSGFSFVSGAITSDGSGNMTVTGDLITNSTLAVGNASNGTIYYLDISQIGNANSSTTSYNSNVLKFWTSYYNGTSTVYPVATIQAIANSGVPYISCSTGLLVSTTGGAGEFQQFVLFDTVSSDTTPYKGFRVSNGSLQINNSAFTQTILTLTDSGQLTILQSGSFGGSGNFGGSLGLTTAQIGFFPYSYSETLGQNISPITLWNNVDSVGGFIGENYSTIQFGMFNRTSSTQGALAGNSWMMNFGINYNGQVFTYLPSNYAIGLSSSVNSGVRNMLDDGSGNMSIAADLTVNNTLAVGNASNGTTYYLNISEIGNANSSVTSYNSNILKFWTSYYNGTNTVSPVITLQAIANSGNPYLAIGSGITTLRTSAFSIAPGASPFHYTPTLNTLVIITGGTGVSIYYSANGGTEIAIGLDAGMFFVKGGDSLIVSYTVAPSMHGIQM